MASVVTTGVLTTPAESSFRNGVREVVADINGALPAGVHLGVLGAVRAYFTVTAGTASSTTPTSLLGGGGTASAALYPQGGVLTVTASANPTSTTTITPPAAADWLYSHPNVPVGGSFTFLAHNLTGSSIVVLGVTITNNKTGFFSVHRDATGTWNTAGVAMA